VGCRGMDWIRLAQDRDRWQAIVNDMVYIFNRSWVDTRWQQNITHLHTNSTHNTEKGKLGSAGRTPSLRIIPWHMPYN
jgi:hypothetical protein